MPDTNTANPKTHIIIKGARVHNLKNIDVAIPKNQLVVITGMSGSGKSSLAFDTLYAEGQRRYVESLSAYARQFMGRMDKPDVDYIRGIAPAIAIEQKVITANPRSTVGTTTEIYDYLKLLFARAGTTISPVSGEEVRKDTVDSVEREVLVIQEDIAVTIYAPLIPHNKRSLKEELAVLLQKGFQRVGLPEGGHTDDRGMAAVPDSFAIRKIEDMLAEEKGDIDEPLKPGTVCILVDRVTAGSMDEDTRNRLADSLQTAFFEGAGDIFLQVGERVKHYCDRFELDGLRFEEPTPNLFSFNNPYGACRNCEGYGNVIGIDEDLVIPDKGKSVYENAIAPWRGEKMGAWLERLVKAAEKNKFPIHRPVKNLTEKQYRLLWEGDKYFGGLNAFFAELEQNTYKIQYRVMLSRYRGKTVCPECRGTRLRKDAGYIKVAGRSIQELVLMPVDELLVFFKGLEFEGHVQKVAERLLAEITNRLGYLCDVGLGYLTLNRLSNTLSGGESQRINLATSLGSSLVGSVYVLDEPSIGLHPKDTHRLIGVLQALKKVGNTVLVVEHEEEMMRAADYVLDIGPEAGTHGGQLVFAGPFNELLQDGNSLTGKYLSGREEIPVPARRRKWNQSVIVEGARENNLKDITVEFPLGVFTVVTGVSGSGKTSLVKKILYPALQKTIGSYTAEHTGKYSGLSGNYSGIGGVEMVDQNPIGRSSRSNPVTYVKAWDDIRALYAGMPEAKAAGIKPSGFSFNVEGGRCDTCLGEGEVKIEMQFMADIYLKCEVCNGQRFKQHILDITYKGKNVADVLDMTIDDAVEFFAEQPKILAKLTPLKEVGLGYVTLGQSSNTLSGGEAQRIKLASFLIKGHAAEHTLFIFDEPTTGLHFHDIKKLLKAFAALIELGHSILVIEHNLEMVKCADWVIDIGPGGGVHGGELVFAGTPEGLAACADSYTGGFLKPHLK